MSYVSKGDFLRQVLQSWKEVPADWSFGRLIANAATIAYGAEMDVRKVDDERLLEGLRALIPDPFEQDPSIIIDPYARQWERENLAFVEGEK